MKKYVKPMMECEEFVANEYCSVCYYFKETGVYARLESELTDGGAINTEWENLGFNDDGFDLLGTDWGDSAPVGKGVFCDEKGLTKILYGGKSTLTSYTAPTGTYYYSKDGAQQVNGVWEGDYRKTIWYLGKDKNSYQAGGGKHPNAS